MASTSSSTLTLSSSSALLDCKFPRQSPAASTQSVTLPTLPPPPAQSQGHPWKPTAYCRKIARNVMAMATGEAPATEVAANDLPEIVKTVQEAWDKVEDKYAVSSLAVAGVVALWCSTGLISAIDRLPLIPGVLELVGIGYTGGDDNKNIELQCHLYENIIILNLVSLQWFVYKNLVFKPDRESLILKVKETYKDIIGSS